jgi:antitoxin (DNA-binding transcriptional repressor) of toxin-antitoxin stability system
MSVAITLEEAQTRLPELIGKLAPGEEILITQDQQAVARLVGERPAERKPRVPGNCKGLITLLVEDDEHLRDFGESMR